MEILLLVAIVIILILLFLVINLGFINRRLSIQIRNSDNENQWRKLAITDDLTGLYNRTAYSEDITELGKPDKKEDIGIILYDVDNFKEINDTKGHLEGDATLQLVAKALLQVYSESPYKVYRIGGDEFAVIANGVVEDELIESMLKLRDVLEKDGEIRLSKGYSIIHKSVNSAFKNADEMLYADKASKKQI